MAKAKIKNSGQRLLKSVDKNKGYFSTAAELAAQTFLPIRLGLLDEAMGGGIPLGNVVEIRGKYSVGKSALAQYLARQFQLSGGVVFWFPFEPSLLKKHLESYNMNMQDFIIANATTVEEAFSDIRNVIAEVAEIRKDNPDFRVLIVWDSVSTSNTFAQVKSDFTDKRLGAVAFAIANFIPTIRRELRAIDSCLLFINQHRASISTTAFAPTDNRPGGESLKHGSSFMATLKMKKQLKRTVNKKEEVWGYQIKVVFDKNHSNKPKAEATFVLNFECGIDPYSTLLLTAFDEGTAKRSGKYWTINGKNYTAESVKEDFDELYTQLFVPKPKSESEIKETKKAGARTSSRKKGK